MAILCFLLPTYFLYLFLRFDLRVLYARALLPAALASVSFGFVNIRVRVIDDRRCSNHNEPGSTQSLYGFEGGPRDFLGLVLGSLPLVLGPSIPLYSPVKLLSSSSPGADVLHNLRHFLCPLALLPAGS